MAGATPSDAQSFVEQHGFLAWLGVEVGGLGEGRAVLTVPARDAVRNVGDGEVNPVHGGVLATLVDTASGFALRTTFDDPRSARLTTTDLDVSYLRPATEDLRATAEVVRAGESMGVVDVRVTQRTAGGKSIREDDASAADAPTAADQHSEDDEPVAVGRTTYRLFREP